MHPLDGARERLNRADQSIQDLNTEVTDFLGSAPVVTFDVDVAAEKPIFTDEYFESYRGLADFLDKTKVPHRLRVLTGEIIHHLRCAFDHIAWQLSSAELQTNSPNQIEFPVFLDEPKPCPVTKNKISRYCRKVEGISSPTALTRIQTLQPYLSRNPKRNPLWLIHDMDRIDKHRELVLVAVTGQINLKANAEFPGLGEFVPWEVTPRNVRIVGPPKVQMKGQLTAQIAFGEFTKRDDQPLIPTLQNLLSFTISSIESFAREFP